MSLPIHIHPSPQPPLLPGIFRKSETFTTFIGYCILTLQKFQQQKLGTLDKNQYQKRRASLQRSFVCTNWILSLLWVEHDRPIGPRTDGSTLLEPVDSYSDLIWASLWRCCESKGKMMQYRNLYRFVTMIIPYFSHAKTTNSTAVELRVAGNTLAIRIQCLNMPRYGFHLNRGNGHQVTALSPPLCTPCLLCICDIRSRNILILKAVGTVQERMLQRETFSWLSKLQNCNSRVAINSSPASEGFSSAVFAGSCHSWKYNQNMFQRGMQAFQTHSVLSVARRL